MSYCSELTCYQADCSVHGLESSAPVTLTLVNGVKIPVLGFGCAFGNWTDRTQFVGFSPEQGRTALPAAFRVGFRHFDTALLYGASHHVLGHTIGAVLARGELKREDIFVTSKVFCPAFPTQDHIGRSFDFSQDVSQVKERILHDVERTLDELNLGRLDLILLHSPGAHNSTDEARGRAFRKEAWAALEEVYKSGRARAIGVSNWLIKHLEGLREDGANIVPMVNQLEITPYITQKDLVKYCQSKNIHVSAWGPFGSGDSALLSDPLLKQLGAKYNKNIGQIILRWLYQQGMSSLPKSNNAERTRSNLQLFDFTLANEDIEAIATLDKNKTSNFHAEAIA